MTRKNLIRTAKTILFTALLTTSAPVLCGQAVAAPQDPSQRIKTFVYDDSEVYTIRTKYGYQTNIVFSPQEEIQTISVGDRSLWQIIPAGSRLFIRPLSENITTNMTLITSKRSYEFDLKSVGSDSESNIYVAKFVYTPKTASAPAENVQNLAVNAGGAVSSGAKKLDKPKAENKPEIKSEPIAQPVRNNYSYTYSGADALAPQLVYDDGKSTFIDYKELKKPLPSVIIIGANGRETPATITEKNGSLVISEIAGEMAIRSRDGEIRIYNESLNAR